MGGRYAAGHFTVGGYETPCGAGQVLGRPDQRGLVDHYQAEFPRPVSDFQTVAQDLVIAAICQSLLIVVCLRFDPSSASHQGLPEARERDGTIGLCDMGAVLMTTGEVVAPIVTSSRVLRSVEPQHGSP